MRSCWLMIAVERLLGISGSAAFTVLRCGFGRSGFHRVGGKHGQFSHLAFDFGIVLAVVRPQRCEILLEGLAAGLQFHGNRPLRHNLAFAGLIPERLRRILQRTQRALSALQIFLGRDLS